MKTTNKKNIIQTWGIACGSASIDQENNSLSLFNVIEEITIDKKGIQDNQNDNKESGSFTIQLPIEIILMLAKNRLGQTAVAELRIDFLDPEGKSLQNMQMGIEIKKEHKRLRFRVKMNGIKISSSGDYVFRISTKETHEETFGSIGEIPLEIRIK